MKFKDLIILPAAFALGCLFSSCGTDSTPNPEAGGMRIISLAPSITETLFALGLGGKVVGVTSYCHYPPEVDTLEKIGGYSDANLEKVLGLRPSLAIMQREHEKQRNFMERYGIKVLTVNYTSIAGICSSFAAIGRACGAEKAADSLIGVFREKLAPPVTLSPSKGDGVGNPPRPGSPLRSALAGPEGEVTSESQSAALLGNGQTLKGISENSTDSTLPGNDLPLRAREGGAQRRPGPGGIGPEGTSPNRPTLLISVGRDRPGGGTVQTVFAAGPGTFYNELILAAGGINILTDSIPDYPRVSQEGILTLLPQVVIDIASAMGAYQCSTLVEDWKSLDRIPAARSGQLYCLSGDYATIPGPRVLNLLEDLRKIISSAREAYAHP